VIMIFMPEGLAAAASRAWQRARAREVLRRWWRRRRA